ncbi:hypothetical protein FVE85_9205 [Porphyridium purpureum]|uniref:Uncharacterized protein n=1 Tax=Porphyridium purpureum TaxID=35688 RepID=A0A5J4YQ89_PORPP|nr:hypothetical protein FVE85_9205 [Porphyridium purpureum]|eukprot:POR0094..scf222_8
MSNSARTAENSSRNAKQVIAHGHEAKMVLPAGFIPAAGTPEMRVHLEIFTPRAWLSPALTPRRTTGLSLSGALQVPSKLIALPITVVHASIRRYGHALLLGCLSLVMIAAPLRKIVPRMRSHRMMLDEIITDIEVAGAGTNPSACGKVILDSLGPVLQNDFALEDIHYRPVRGAHQVPLRVASLRNKQEEEGAREAHEIAEADAHPRLGPTRLVPCAQ